MRSWLAVALALALPSCAAAPAPSPEPDASLPPLVDDDAFVRAMGRSVVLLEVLDEKDEVVVRGTAFCIGPARVMTAWHVVATATKARIRTDAGTFHHVRGLLARGEGEEDLAVLVVDAAPGDLRPLAFAGAAPEPGARVCLVGAPFEPGDGCAPSYGVILGGAKDPNLLRVRVPAAPGWSGSPLLDARGEVVGVVRVGFGPTTVITSGTALRGVAARSETAEPAPLERVSPRGVYGREEKQVRDWREERPVWLEPAARAATLGDIDGAAKDLWELLGDHENEPHGWFFLAWLEDQRGRSNEAIKAFRRVRDLRPGESRSWTELGWALAKAARYEEAVEAYRGAVERDAANRDALYGLGYALGALGRYNEAIEAFKKVLVLDPTYQAARTSLESAEAKRKGR